MDAPRTGRFCALLALSCAWPLAGCALFPTRSDGAGEPKILWSGEQTLADLEAQAAADAAAAAQAQPGGTSDIQAWANSLSPEAQAAAAAQRPAPGWPEFPQSPPNPNGYPILASDAQPPPGLDPANPAASAAPPPPVFTPAAPTEPPAVVVAAAPAPPVRDHQPPILGSIQIAESINVPRAISGPRGVDVGGESNALAGKVRGMLGEYLSAPDAASLRAEVDQRLLALLGGDARAARAPLEMASPEQQQIVTNLIDVISTMRTADGGDPLAESRALLGRLDALRGALAAESDLSLPTFEICRSVAGFGQFDAFADRAFAAGRPLEFVAYCELKNFVSRQEAGEFRSEFAIKLAVMDRLGQTVFEMEQGAIQDRCKSRRTDCFISPLVRVPASLNPGQYFVKLTVIDKIGGKVAETRTTIQIRPGS